MMKNKREVKRDINDGEGVDVESVRKVLNLYYDLSYKNVRFRDCDWVFLGGRIMLFSAFLGVLDVK